MSSRVVRASTSSSSSSCTFTFTFTPLYSQTQLLSSSSDIFYPSTSNFFHFGSVNRMSSSSSSTQDVSQSQPLPPLNPILSKSLYAFDLPLSILNELALRRSTLPQLNENQESTSKPSSSASSSSSLSCSICPPHSSAPTPAAHRAHLATDWHRFNLVASRAGKGKGRQVLREEEFEKLVDGEYIISSRLKSWFDRGCRLRFVQFSLYLSLLQNWNQILKKNKKIPLRIQKRKKRI